MIFNSTSVHGVLEIQLEPHLDDRGSFSRIFCRREFERAGLKGELAQCNLSGNHRRGTIRGLHYQAAPSDEAKVVRCVRGSIYDVALDLRPNSPTYLRHDSAELSAETGNALYVPPGCAHGFQTLEDDVLVLYLMTDFYEPERSQGVRWDDPAFGIQWPIQNPLMADRDRNYPDFRRSEAHG